MANEPISVMLEGLVLAVLESAPTYGYLIAKRMREAGASEIKGGTLYPILNRLADTGYLASEWREGSNGPSRRYYEITTAGRDHLRDVRAQWNDQRGVIDRFLNEGVACGP